MTVLLERKKIQIQTRKDFLNFLCVFIFAYQIGKDSKDDKLPCHCRHR